MGISHGYATDHMRAERDMCLSRALFVWPAHRQIAPHSNSSLSEPECFFPPSHTCV